MCLLISGIWHIVKAWHLYALIGNVKDAGDCQVTSITLIVSWSDMGWKNGFKYLVLNFSTDLFHVDRILSGTTPPGYCESALQLYIGLVLESHHHHHHVVPPAWISLTLSCHFSLSFIASGRSSEVHPISSHSCCMHVRAGRPAFARPWVGIHRSTSLSLIPPLNLICSPLNLWYRAPTLQYINFHKVVFIKNMWNLPFYGPPSRLVSSVGVFWW